MKKRYIVLGIVIPVICLILLIILFVCSHLKDNNNEVPYINSVGENFTDTTNSIVDAEEIDPWSNKKENPNDKKLVRVYDLYSYFLMKQCLQNYYNTNNALNIIDKEAIQFLGLNQNNISQLNKDFNNFAFCIDEIYKQSIDTSKMIYVVYHRIQKNEVAELTDSVVFIKIDERNVDFSIYPYEYLKNNNLLELKQDDIVEIKNLEEISVNTDNNYKTSLISKDEQTCLQELYDRFLFELKFDVEKLYDRIQTNYKNSKFANYEEFLQYINNKKEIFFNNKISKYRKKEYDKYEQYVAILEDDSRLIFNTTTIMDYNIMLDDFSTITEEYYDMYKISMPNIQGEYCIDRVMKAINEKNYEFVYSKLNSVLKNNYYPTIQDFEDFLVNNFFEKNNYEVDKEFKQIGSNVFQYNVKITDKTENSKLYKEFIMTVYLKDEADFNISIVIDK